jgi:hypothetical protein
VIVTTPFWVRQRRDGNVPIAPVPSNTTFVSGTMLWSEEVAVTVRLVAAVSTSPTVNGMGPVPLTASSSIVLSGEADG